MDNLVVLLGAFLLLVSLLLTTLNLTLREMSRARLAEQLERRGRSRLIDALYERRDELVLMTATGRTLANIAVGFVVLWLVVLPEHPIGWQSYAITFAVAAVLIFLFGVGLPHAWAKCAGEGILAALAPLLVVAGSLFRPLVAIKNLFERVIRQLTGARPEADGASEVEQEIIDAVSEGEAEGHVSEEEKEMIVSVIEFRNQRVAEIMTPRIEIVGIEVGSTLETIRKIIAEEGYSRMPVYEESLDNVLGILHTKDLLMVDPDQPFDLRAIMRKAIFVPDSKTARDLLSEFKRCKTKIAVVLDEYGGTAGLVTTTDVYDELLGDIADEDEQPEPPAIVKIDSATMEIDARVRVDEFNDQFDLHLPDDEGYDTVGGYILSRLGRIPKAGDEFTIGPLRIQVLDADERRINRVRIHMQYGAHAQPEQAPP